MRGNISSCHAWVVKRAIHVGDEEYESRYNTFQLSECQSGKQKVINATCIL